MVHVTDPVSSPDPVERPAVGAPPETGAVDADDSPEVGPVDAPEVGAGPLARQHPVVVYTLLRIGMLVAVGAVLYLVGLRGVWLLLFAFLISGVVSAFALSRPREGAALGISTAVKGVNARLDASARAEDEDDDLDDPPAAPADAAVEHDLDERPVTPVDAEARHRSTERPTLDGPDRPRRRRRGARDRPGSTGRPAR